MKYWKKRHVPPSSCLKLASCYYSKWIWSIIKRIDFILLYKLRSNWQRPLTFSIKRKALVYYTYLYAHWPMQEIFGINLTKRNQNGCAKKYCFVCSTMLFIKLQLALSCSPCLFPFSCPILRGNMSEQTVVRLCNSKRTRQQQPEKCNKQRFKQ